MRRYHAQESVDVFLNFTAFYRTHRNLVRDESALRLDGSHGYRNAICACVAPFYVAICQKVKTDLVVCNFLILLREQDRIILGRVQRLGLLRDGRKRDLAKSDGFDVHAVIGGFIAGVHPAFANHFRPVLQGAEFIVRVDKNIQISRRITDGKGVVMLEKLFVLRLFAFVARLKGKIIDLAAADDIFPLAAQCGNMRLR